MMQQGFESLPLILTKRLYTFPKQQIAKHPCPHWHVATAKMDRNLIQKKIMGIVHFLGRNTKIM